MDTEAQQILAALSDLGDKQAKQTEAINSLGANVQWLVDNVQGLFQMFSSPHFMAQMQSMLMGGADGSHDPSAEGTGDVTDSEETYSDGR